MCFFFFCNQKTAYELRISGWSSDVCSSYLIERLAAVAALHDEKAAPRQLLAEHLQRLAAVVDRQHGSNRPLARARLVDKIGRASCRKEGVSTCRARWSPYH